MRMNEKHIQQAYEQIPVARMDLGRKRWRWKANVLDVDDGDCY